MHALHAIFCTYSFVKILVYEICDINIIVESVSTETVSHVTSGFHGNHWSHDYHFF